MKRGVSKKTRLIAFIISLTIVASAVMGIGYFLNTKYYPPILMYHHVENVPQASLFVTPKHFEEQMRFLRHNKYKIVSLDELVDMIKSGAKISHNVVAVTFDDGNENNYLYAFPILKEYKIPATIFLISDLIDKGGYITASQIREMSKEGIDFGSHTKTHRNLKDATEEEMTQEVLQSKKAIEAVIGKPLTAFSYPFGESNAHGTKILKDAGFKAAFLTMPRDGYTKINPYLLRRLKANDSESIITFWAKTSGYYTWFKAHRWKKRE